MAWITLGNGFRGLSVWLALMARMRRWALVQWQGRGYAADAMAIHAKLRHRTRAKVRGAWSLALLAGLGWPRRAAADGAPVEGARALFAAQNMVALGRYREACGKFEESQRRQPALATELSLADCWEKVGRAARAWEVYRDIAEKTPAGARAKRLAGARAAAIEPHLAHLKIRVAHAAASDMRVSLDGAALASKHWGRDVRVDAGRHQVYAAAPGHRPWQRVVHVSAGSPPTRIDVPQLEVATDGVGPDSTLPTWAGSAPVENPLLPVDAIEQSAAPSHTAAYVAGGIGLAGLTVGALSAWLSSSKLDAARKLCTRTTEGCPPLARDDYEALKRYAKNAREVSHVAIGVGALGLVTAGIFLYVTRKKEAIRNATVKVSPSFGTDGMGVSVSGSF